jgi:hypothetical protein
LTLSDVGAMTITGLMTSLGLNAGTGTIQTTGEVSGGSVSSSSTVFSIGDITSNSGRLRAGLGAYNSGDQNAATILNDFSVAVGEEPPNGIFTANFPNKFFIQCVSASSPVLGAGLNTFTVALPAAYSNIVAAFICYDGETPPSGTGLSVQPNSQQTVAVTINIPTGGGSLGVVVLTFGLA